MDDANATFRVEARVIGRRKAANDPWLVALPPIFLQETTSAEHVLLLRDLIAYIVREEVRAFQTRQEERRLLRVLSPQEINNAVDTGKVSMGGEQGQEQTVVDEDAAVQVALQAFEDGIYLVFLDGQQRRDLSETVQPRPDSVLLFIRLVALVGG